MRSGLIKKWEEFSPDMFDGIPEEHKHEYASLIEEEVRQMLLKSNKFSVVVVPDRRKEFLSQKGFPS